MKIGIIQATTQVNKNELLFNLTKKVVDKYNYEVINFGVKGGEETFSYTEIAFLIALLINSKVVDFIISGCSSGQGMNMACNSLPGLLSGYLPTPQDAYLFGRINDGNVASFPLGFGWLGELNLEYSLEKLFDGDFGIGYPKEVAKRKIKETLMVKKLNQVSKNNIIQVMEKMDKEFMDKVLSKKDVINYIINHSREKQLVAYLKNR